MVQPGKIEVPEVSSLGHGFDWVNRAKRETEALKKRMSKKGALGLPKLLDERRLEYGIPDGTFGLAPSFDRVYIHQIPRWETAGGADSIITLTDQGSAKEQESSPIGIIIGAGLSALDHLASNGIDLGHICAFIRLSPTRIETDRAEGFSWHVVTAHTGDIAGSYDLQDELRDGRKRIVWDDDNAQHVIEVKNKKGWSTFHPKLPFMAADY